MKLIVDLLIRTSFACVALFTYLILFPMSGNILAVIVVISVGSLIAIKGVLLLIAVSFLLDRLFLNRLLNNFRYWTGILIWLLIYCFVGLTLALFVYGKDSFLLFSGSVTSIIYIFYYQSYQHILTYQQRRIKLLEEDV